MALYRFLCGVSLMIILSSNGCHSDVPSCGIWKSGRGPIPWQVVIVIDENVQCLGNLINEILVLTDAHCVLGPDHDTVVYLGCIDLLNPSGGCQDWRMVENATINMPTPESAITRDGLGVLTLSRPVNFSDYIFPICLAEAGSYFYSGMEIYAATGSTPVTQVKVPIVGHNECKCTHPRLKSYMICAGHKERSDTCEGCLDNLGGGLWVNNNGYWTLIAVTRFNQNCPSVESLRLYTSVAFCIRFILEAAKGTSVGKTSIQPGKPDPDTDFQCPKPFQCPQPKCPQTGCPEPRCQQAGCPQTGCPQPDPCCRDNRGGGSVFDSSVNVGPSSLLVSLCVLVLAYYTAP